MEDIDSSPTSPNPRKRAASDEDSPEKKLLNLKGTQFMMPTPPDTDQSSNASPTCNNEDTTGQASPAASSSALSSVEVVLSNPVQSSNATIDLTPNVTAASSSGPPPKKRRKLTPAEKEQQRKEKEAKEAEKVEQRARKDEEKRKRAEDREAKKRNKELDEERKAQDQMKKERAQMRIGAFWKPAAPAKESTAEDGADNAFDSARRKSMSLEPFDAVADQIRKSESPIKGTPPPVAGKNTPAKLVVSDYRKHFLPFQLQLYSSLAPFRTHVDLEGAQEAFDRAVNDLTLREKYDLGLVDSYASLGRQFADEGQEARGLPLPNVRQLIEQVQGLAQQPIDLTNDTPTRNPLEALQVVSLRHIEFERDVRPPYFGTYSKIRSPRASRKLRRNPFKRTREDTDYDYDSEQEWVPPEEGDEDILEDEEDEVESVGDANEMDGFLDDEDDALKSKRKMVTGDLLPTSTGLCWENESGKIISSIEGDTPLKSMHSMRMGVLLPGFSGKVLDPFSSAYWHAESTTAPQVLAVPAAEPSVAQANGLMAPPRPPLQPRPNSNGTLDRILVGASEGEKGPITSVSATQGSKGSRKPPPKTLGKEDMEEFKEAVVNSPLSKADLMKGLKAR